MAHDPEMRNKAIRLRVNERYSLQEIASTLGISKATASLWVREHPLTPEEIEKRHEHITIPHPEKGVSIRSESKFHRMFQERLPDNPTPQYKAKVAEAAVLFRLVLLGTAPFGSVFDGEKTDWLVEVDRQKRPLKIQVKSVTVEKRGSPSVSLRCSNGRKGHRRYKEGEFDILVGYDVYSDICYVWSWDEVKHLNHTVATCDDVAEQWGKIFETKE